MMDKKDYKPALQAIEDWPALVYEEEAFPDVRQFCRLYLQAASEEETRDVLAKLKLLNEHTETAKKERDVARLQKLEKEYRDMMRLIHKHNAGAA